MGREEVLFILILIYLLCLLMSKWCDELQLVKFYKRLGFKEVYQVEGGSLRDLSDMLVWGGVGTRMDANIQDLMIKWCSRFKPKQEGGVFRLRRSV